MPVGDSAVLIGVVVAMWVAREAVALVMRARSSGVSADVSGAHPVAIGVELAGLRERMVVVERKLDDLLRAVGRLEGRSPGK